MKYPVNFEIELKTNTYGGLYIALEGIDGSGKTTQVEKLAAYFESKGKEVLKTHEPRRDGPIGDLVKDVLKKEVQLPEIAVQYLFAAQRAVHLEQIVIPALKEGMAVISDRSFWSAVPYGLLDRFQAGRDENPDQLLAALSVLSVYHEFIAPDKTIMLDVPVEIAAKRLGDIGRKSEIYENPEQLGKIKQGYDFLLSNFSDAIKKIDASGDVEDVTAKLISALDPLEK